MINKILEFHLNSSLRKFVIAREQRDRSNPIQLPETPETPSLRGVSETNDEAISLLSLKQECSLFFQSLAMTNFREF